MKLILSRRFQRDLNNLLKSNPQIKEKITKTFKLMQVDLTHPSPRLHKLSGTNNWSVSVDISIRIILHKESDKLFLLRIGYHDEVY
jgi:mRNA-degrading endonuclease YafQ of YafQ-DinJ toxin-antitoxin module